MSVSQSGSEARTIVAPGDVVHLPNAHAVDERRGAVGGPQAAVGKLGDVPHQLVHHLRELDGVCRGAGAAPGGARAGAVGDVALVVRAVQVLSIPASKVSLSVTRLPYRDDNVKLGGWGRRETYVGKMIVWRIILQDGLAGISTVSEPVQGAPPTKGVSVVLVQQRWQMFAPCTLLGSVLAAFPASMRKP